MRVVFFGTPEFAVPTLDAVTREHEVTLVVAQPDKPAGRGMKLHAPAVAVRARELGLPILQPSKIREEGFLTSISQASPDIGVVVAYGRILPPALLAIPRHGFINVHASLLPRWRGAAPIQRSIEAGDDTTGVTIMRVDNQLDHGPVLSMLSTPIGSDERASALSSRLSAIGGEALARVLREIEAGTVAETEQDHARATHAAKIEKHEGEISFREPAGRIYDRFRAFDPWPGVFFSTSAEIVKVTEMRPVGGSGAPREIVAMDDHAVDVATAGGAIRIVEMQRAGKPRMPAPVVARALGWRVGHLIPD